MKIKEYLYNNEKDETIALAYEKVCEIAKKLNVKLKPEKDFKERMGWAYDSARRYRYVRVGDNKLRDISTIQVSVEASSHSRWNDPSKHSFSIGVSHELTDPQVTDISSVVAMLDYCESVKIIVKIDWYQAWRRQAKKKQVKTLADLAGVASGASGK